MARLRQRDFSGGWFPVSPATSIPKNALRDAQGVAPFYGASVKSRRGSILGAVLGPGIHSQFIWHGQRYLASANGLFGRMITSAASLSVMLAGFGGGPLRFAKGIPTPEIDAQQYPNESVDHLYVVGAALTGSGAITSGFWSSFKVDANNQISPMGLDTPPDDWVIGLQPPITLSIADFEIQHPWSPSADADVLFVTDLKQVGNAALQVHVSNGTAGYITRSTPVDVGFAPTTHIKSPKQDWICLWVHVDDPKNLKEIQLQFDCGGPDAAPADMTKGWEKTFSYRVLVSDSVIDSNIKAKSITDTEPGAERRDNKPYFAGGVGSQQPNTNFGDKKAEDEAPAVDMTDVEAVRAVSELATTRVSPTTNTWTLLRIPKLLFDASTPEMQDDHALFWSRLRRTRITVSANDDDDVTCTFDELFVHLGVGTMGDYKACTTFRSSKTGVRSQPSKVKEVKNALRQAFIWSQLRFTGETVTYADEIEFWRSLGGGNVLFKVVSRPFTDFTSDNRFFDIGSDFEGMHELVDIPQVRGGKMYYLKALTVPQDNIRPSRLTFDIAGPVNGRMWSLVKKQQGRWFYSPPGRHDVIAGFVDVTSDEEPFNKLVHWTQLYGFSQRKLFVLRGQAEPFLADELVGIPGTRFPDSIAICESYGIAYWAEDGPRLFNGNSSIPLAPEAVRAYFQGESTSITLALDSNYLFSRLNRQTLYGVYHEREYIISDGRVALAVDLKTGVWRSLGVGFGPGVSDQGQLSVIVNPKLVDAPLLFWEMPGEVTDNLQSIAFRVECASECLEDQTGETKIVQFVYFDIDTQGQAINAVLLYKGNETASYNLGNIVTAGRQRVEFPIVNPGELVGVQLRADLILACELFEWGVDVHLPEQGGQLT